jgi:RHS repeat-associated protein
LEESPQFVICSPYLLNHDGITPCRSWIKKRWDETRGVAKDSWHATKDFVVEHKKEIITNSLYDPEEEFQEIGVQIGEKTFWKIYGPDACDAISDETGASVNLMHNALRQLTGIVSPQGTLYSEKPPSFYGPLEINPSVSSDLVSYAQSLNWHSKAQDPTGFIWMGGRYYDSRSGQFLSQDPVSYPMCLDLYAYANGDPVNYFDPDGRFASPIYQPVKATVLNVWNSPQFQGGLKATTGFIESTTGAALMPTPLAPFGAAMVIHGADRASSGIYMAMTGRQASTMTSQLLQKTGMSQERADRWDDNANFLLILGGGGLAYKFAKGTTGLTVFSPKITDIVASNERALLNFTDTAGKHMFEVERRVPIHILDKVIRSPTAFTRDPQGASNAMMYYSQVWKNGKLYNIEVLYDKATNTISHFQYTQKPIGPLTKVSK